MGQQGAVQDSRMGSLDTMRGAAILMVVCFHVSVRFRPADWLATLVNLGNLGVQLFFLISAITMSLMWRQRLHESHRQAKFYVRRFFRIAPLFWIAMLFYAGWRSIAAFGSPDIHATLTDVVLTGSFLHGFSPSAINKLVPGGWSIAVEMSFYAVFPLLVARLRDHRETIRFAFLSYLILGVVATLAVERTIAPEPFFVYYSMLTQFPVFPIGMLVYQLAIGRETPDRRYLAAFAVAWLAVAFAGKYALGMNTRPAFWTQVFVLGLIAHTVVVRGFSMGFLSYIGRLSYSMYLFHFAVIDVVYFGLGNGGVPRGTFGYLIALAAVVGMTALVARLSSASFERWSADMARPVTQWFDRGVRRPA